MKTSKKKEIRIKIVINIIVESWKFQWHLWMLTCKDWGCKLGKGAPQPHHHQNLWVQKEDQHLRGRNHQWKGAACMAGAGVTPPGETPFLLVYICNLIAPCMPRILLRLPSIITYSLHRFSADKDDSVTDCVLPTNDRGESFHNLNGATPLVDAFQHPWEIATIIQIPQASPHHHH